MFSTSQYYLYSMFISVVFYRTMAFKLILLVTVVSIYAAEAIVVERDKMLGGADYLPCDSCKIAKKDYPEEG